MHTLDLANFPVTDTLKMLASLLAKMTQANDQIKSRAHSHSDSSSTSTSSPSFTRFHARSVPSIDIYSYLARILKYCPTTNECFLSLLVYFDRMSKNALATTGKPFSIDSFNIHRLIISGIMVSSKFFSDVFFTNSRYAKVGGLPVSELNHLELEFLILNEFRLSISIEELQRYGDQLLRHWVMEEEMRSNGSIYDSIRFGPNSPSGRWDPHEKNSISKRSRRHPSSDDTNTSKGGGPKAVKEEDQDNHHYSRTHRRDSSLSSAKSLNISSYHTPLTSSPTSFASPRKAASSGRAHSTSGTSPNSSTVHLNGTSSQAITNGSPMRGPYPSTAFNTHHMHYPNVHKAYPSAHHHNSQHQRSVSLESTIKRASSSGSLLNLNRSRSGDLTDDLQQYHHQSSPKQINPEDVAYRTAAPPFPNAPPPQITTTSALNVTNPKYASSTGNLSNGASHNISSMIRRMSHDSPVNSFQQVPNTYHYSTYPPQPNANSSQPSTSMSTFPPSIPGISFNPAATVAAAAHNAAAAALSYARRASLALPPLPSLPRHPLSGFHSSAIPSPVSPLGPGGNEGLGSIGGRRGSIPTWNGTGNNGTVVANGLGNGFSGLPNGGISTNASNGVPSHHNSNSTPAIPIPATTASLPSTTTSLLNGHTISHLHPSSSSLNGITSLISSSPNTPNSHPVRRGSWAVVTNPNPLNTTHHGHYSTPLTSVNGHHAHPGVHHSHSMGSLNVNYQAYPLDRSIQPATATGNGINNASSREDCLNLMRDATLKMKKGSVNAIVGSGINKNASLVEMERNKDGKSDRNVVNGVKVGAKESK